MKRPLLRSSLGNALTHCPARIKIAFVRMILAFTIMIQRCHQIMQVLLEYLGNPLKSLEAVYLRPWVRSRLHNKRSVSETFDKDQAQIRSHPIPTL